IPAELAEEAKKAHEALVELVAEGKDELMEEFFEKGTIPEDHLIAAIHEAIREDRLFPVLYTSGLGNIGTDHLLDFIADYAQTAAERGTVNGAPTPNNGRPTMRKVADSDPASISVFQTATHPF